jgi:hypothetical protein
LSESAALATSTPRTNACPPSGVRSPSRISTVVVLPAEEAEDLAGLHLEVDPVDRVNIAVALDQALDADDGLCGDGPRGLHGRMVPRNRYRRPVGRRAPEAAAGSTGSAGHMGAS